MKDEALKTWKIPAGVQGIKFYGNPAWPICKVLVRGKWRRAIRVKA